MEGRVRGEGEGNKYMEEMLEGEGARNVYIEGRQEGEEEWDKDMDWKVC